MGDGRFESYPGVDAVSMQGLPGVDKWSTRGPYGIELRSIPGRPGGARAWIFVPLDANFVLFHADVPRLSRCSSAHHPGAHTAFLTRPPAASHGVCADPREELAHAHSVPWVCNAGNGAIDGGTSPGFEKKKSGYREKERERTLQRGIKKEMSVSI